MALSLIILVGSHFPGEIASSNTYKLPCALKCWERRGNWGSPMWSLGEGYSLAMADHTNHPNSFDRSLSVGISSFNMPPTCWSDMMYISSETDLRNCVAAYRWHNSPFGWIILLNPTEPRAVNKLTRDCVYGSEVVRGRPLIIQGSVFEWLEFLREECKSTN